MYVANLFKSFIWWWGSISEDLWSVEYSFIAITPSSTLSPSRSDYGSNWSVENYSYCAKKQTF